MQPWRSRAQADGWDESYRGPLSHDLKAARARRLCFFEKTVTCELESVELVGRVLGGV